MVPCLLIIPVFVILVVPATNIIPKHMAYIVFYAGVLPDADVLKRTPSTLPLILVLVYVH